MGLILPNGNQTINAQTLELSMRNPNDPDAKFSFVLPQPDSPTAMQLDTLTKATIYLLNEQINSRVLLTSLNEQLVKLNEQLAQLLAEQKRNNMEQRLNNSLHTRGRP